MRISIVTVCYNSEKWINQAIESVNSQENVEKEHWVIDGGSTDKTLNIISSHLKPWRYVLSESDKGMYDAMNKGIALVTGDVVGFLNSDDVYEDSHVLQTVVDAFKDPSIQACWGDLVYVRQNDISQVVRYWSSSSFRLGSFAYGWNPPHPTFFVRSEIYRQFGGFNLEYGMGNDVELMARLLECHHINGCHLPRLMVRMRLGGASNRRFSSVWFQNFELLRAFRDLGLHPSVIIFFSGKLLSRSWQYINKLFQL